MRRWGPRLLLVGALVALQGAPPARAADDGLSYVALGDSYTSGPLVLPHDTTWVPQGCGQSIRNYPHLAAPAIGATEFTDVSCGSATIDDLYEPQTGLPDGGTNAPQLDALGPEVDVVTIGMGGNDVGFVGLALDCVRLVGPPTEQPCTPDYTSGGHDVIAEKIAEVGPELGQALEDIHDAAPNAEVFVVSYPTALPDDAVACWPYLPILPEDMPYLVAKFKEMNAMLAEQASLHDATYIDIYTPSIGHDACQLPAIAWVNGMVVVPPSYPAHPNELGLVQSGAFVAAAIQDRLDEVAPGPPVADPVTPPVEPAATAGAGTLPATGAAGGAVAGAALLVSALAVRATQRVAGRASSG